jgi:hypothetical protein
VEMHRISDIERCYWAKMITDVEIEMFLLLKKHRCELEFDLMKAEK